MLIMLKKKPLANVIVIGAQWGDEGKGKITDLLSKSVIFPFPSSPHWAPITITLAKGLF